MFRVSGDGKSYRDLSAREAVAKARALRRQGINDVEIFKADETRISLYGLDQLLRAERAES